ncbi:MAG TPA: DUF2795 domain-containing protein [Actinophytocola sp.]|uniref:DUF2795 domain-containing protein n=1 Tax=Actinophytocola sp. TaxID=1872138 RepID=UPI002DB7CD84|nr:DUF2795 domain-containing protein [Actinophytocola sp.]HEU5473286.1 DUF2795 domain-containing protein [Actinophytocola sp.]
MSVSVEKVLADARFPADRNELLTHATKHQAAGETLAVLAALPDRRYATRREVTDAIIPAEPPGGLRTALGALLSLGTAIGAARTVFRLVRAPAMGPVGLIIAAAQAATALVAAARAVGRWRAGRRRR